MGPTGSAREVNVKATDIRCISKVLKYVLRFIYSHVKCKKPTDLFFIALLLENLYFKATIIFLLHLNCRVDENVLSIST